MQKSVQNQCFRRFLLARFYSGHVHDLKTVLRCSVYPGATSLEWGNHTIRIHFRTFPEISCFRNVALGPLCSVQPHVKGDETGCHCLQDFSRAQVKAMPFSHTVEWPRMDGRNELPTKNRSTLKKSFPKSIKNSSRNRF